MFDYELFAYADEKSVNFNNLLTKSTVFQLKMAPSDDVKKIVAELMISKLIQYSYNLEQTKNNRIRLYCIVDEVHRMVYPGSPLERGNLSENQPQSQPNMIKTFKKQ